MSNYFQNQNTYTIAVPTASGISLTLFPGEVVQGISYSVFDYHDILVSVVGPYTYPTLRYSWPSTGTSSEDSGAITEITADLPLSGGGNTGNVHIGLTAASIDASYITPGSLTAALFGYGEIVKGITIGLDTLYDNVTLVAGNNIEITYEEGNTVLISTTSSVLTSVEGTSPISVSTLNGVATVAMDITPIALQELDYTFTPPVEQLGTAAISNLFVNEEEDVLYGLVAINTPIATVLSYNSVVPSYVYLKGLDATTHLFTTLNDSDLITSYIDADAKSFIPGLANTGLTETASFSLRADSWSNSTLPYIYFNLVVPSDNFINVPFDLFNTLTIQQTDTGDVNKIGIGEILGVPSLSPLIDFGTQELIPAIKLGSTSESGKDLALTVHNNGSIAPTIGLYTDGTITATQVITPFEIHTNIYLTAGNYSVGDYQGISTFICDSVSGVSSFNLPELTQESVNGQTYLFKKYDITTNAVVIVPAIGQTIDNTLTQYTLSTQGAFVRVQAVIVGGGSPKQFWITC
jgi:hypothetical protein